MKKLKPPKTHKPNFNIRTGTTEEFFATTKNIFRSFDKKEPLKKSKTLIFEDPSEMLHFLSTTKIQLIKAIRGRANSLTKVAKLVKRNRASVYRDIRELESFGLVKTHDEINPGHGKQKIVELSASFLKLEAYI